MADKKERKTVKDMLRDGAILKEYTQDYFISVSPAPSISMVLFSIVKQGTKGKDASKVWISFDQFRNLCDDITSAEGAKKLSADAASQFPSAYKYTTGVDGCNRLNIGGGRKGVRIQTQVKADTWDNRMVVVSYESIKNMAFYFRLCMGLIPCTRYYKELADTFWEGVEERDRHLQQRSDTGKDGACAPPVFKVVTKGPVRKDGNVFYCPVWDNGNLKNWDLCFTAGHMMPADKWDKFQMMAADGVTIKIKAITDGKKRMFFSEFAGKDE